MAKEELLTIEGVIDEILPDGRFGVMLENDLRIIAYTAGKMRRYRIRSIVGDRVHVEMTPYDVSTYGAVLVLLCAVTAVASYVPARLAARVEPLIALRHE